MSDRRADYGRATNITTATTTTVKSGPGVLISLVINKAIASSTYTIYDNTAASGTKIGTVTLPATLTANQFTLPYLIQFSTGLTIVTSSTDDITVVFK